MDQLDAWGAGCGPLEMQVGAVLALGYGRKHGRVAEGVGTDAYLLRLEAAFRSALTHAHANDEIDPDADVDALASFFTMSLIGVAALVRAEAEPSRVKAACSAPSPRCATPSRPVPSWPCPPRRSTAWPRARIGPRPSSD